MARLFTIPEMYIEEIMQMYDKGKGNTEIANYLNTTYKLKVNGMNVYRRVKELRKIKSDSIKDSIKEAAAVSGLNCVELVDKSIIALNKEAHKLLESGNIKEKAIAKQLFDTSLRYIDSKMGIIGINKSDGSINTDAEDSLRDLLKKLGQ